MSCSISHSKYTVIRPPNPWRVQYCPLLWRGGAEGDGSSWRSDAAPVLYCSTGRGRAVRNSSPCSSRSPPPRSSSSAAGGRMWLRFRRWRRSSPGGHSCVLCWVGRSTPTQRRGGGRRRLGPDGLPWSVCEKRRRQTVKNELNKNTVFSCCCCCCVFAGNTAGFRESRYRTIPYTCLSIEGITGS